MTMMDPSMLSGMFQTVLDHHLKAYLDASEVLADDDKGGNRRTVANAAKDRHGDKTDFARRVLDAIVREASPKGEDGKVSGPPDVDLLFHLLNSFASVQKDNEHVKAVDQYVADEVKKLKANVDPERAKASDDEKNAARKAQMDAFEGIENVRNLARLSVPQFGEDAVEEFLAQIPSDITKPRKPTGPTGPRLRNASNPKAKYEFFDGTNNLGNQLSKVAAVLGAELSDVKDSIAEKFVIPEDGEDDEAFDLRVKAWFNAAPDNFTFTVKGEKDGSPTETVIRAVVTRSVEDDSDEESETEE